MKRKSLIVAMLLSTLLCGCTNSQSKITVKTFEKDDNTLTREAASAWIVNENTTAKDENEGLAEDRHDNGIEIHDRDNCGTDQHHGSAHNHSNAAEIWSVTCH